jgi:hypothetical protein
VSSSTLVSQGQTKITNSQAEVTSIQWVPADPKLFEVPTTYTAVPLPSAGGATGGSIPPQ